MRLNMDMIFNISTFLENYDLLNLLKTNKEFNLFFKKKYILNYFLTRYHPMVFNIFDNYCRKCNFKKVLELIILKKYTRCKHY